MDFREKKTKIKIDFQVKKSVKRLYNLLLCVDSVIFFRLQIAINYDCAKYIKNGFRE